MPNHYFQILFSAIYTLNRIPVTQAACEYVALNPPRCTSAQDTHTYMQKTIKGCSYAGLAATSLPACFAPKISREEGHGTSFIKITHVSSTL